MGLNIYYNGKVRTRTYILTAGEKHSLGNEAFASAKWEDSVKKEDIFFVPGILCKGIHAAEGMRVRRMFLLRSKDVLQRTKEGLLRRK